MIVTIDGPAGAGKSSVARRLAQRLGFEMLDTGAMYRTVVLAAIQAGIELEDAEQRRQLAREIEIKLEDDRVFLNRSEVTREIRQPRVGQVIHHVADDPMIREHLVQLQRKWAEGRDIVCEGRDQGSVVFPEAECKIFLNATPEERARRRMRQLGESGEDAAFHEILDQQNERDQRDRNRPVGALVQASDALEVMTDGLSEEEVVDRLESLVQQRQPHR